MIKTDPNILMELIAEGSALREDPGYQSVFHQITQIQQATGSLFICRTRGGWLYDLYRSKDHPRGLWRRTPEIDMPTKDTLWETVFDVDAHAEITGEDWVWRGPTDSFDGNRVLLNLSLGGTDETVSREFDLQTCEFVSGGFNTPRARQFSAWESADSILVASTDKLEDQTSAGLPGVVRRITRGQGVGDATEVFRCSAADLQVRVWCIPSEHDVTTVFLTQHDLRRSSLTLGRNGQLWRLDLPKEADKLVTDRFVIWEPTAHDALDRGSLRARALTGDSADYVLFEPTGTENLLRFMAAGNYVILLVQVGDAHSLKIVDLCQIERGARVIPFPGKVTHLDASWFATSPDGTPQCPEDLRLNVITQSLTSPPVLYRVTPNCGVDDRPVKLAADAPSFDPSLTKETSFSAVAEDGVKIPYRLAIPRNHHIGPRPIVFTAYGGFGLSVDAGYQRLLGAILLANGIGLGIAHIRGGGEFGPAWHEAGRGANKPRAFLDCACVARDLTRRGLTSPDSLGFYGGSHGGLVGAVMATKFPECFGAIFLDAPLTDLERFHQSGVGSSWIEEFGDPETADDLKRLKAWSPLRCLQSSDQVQYPPLRILSSLNDDRVSPNHALNFATALRTAGQQVELIVEESGGHVGSGRLEEAAHHTALLSSFFLQNLK